MKQNYQSRNYAPCLWLHYDFLTVTFSYLQLKNDTLTTTQSKMLVYNCDVLQCSFKIVQSLHLSSHFSKLFIFLIVIWWYRIVNI